MPYWQRWMRLRPDQLIRFSISRDGNSNDGQLTEYFRCGLVSVSVFFWAGGGGERNRFQRCQFKFNPNPHRPSTCWVPCGNSSINIFFFSNFNSFRRLFVIVVAAGGCSVATFPQFTRRWLRNAVEIEPLFQTPTWMKSN